MAILLRGKKMPCGQLSITDDNIQVAIRVRPPLASEKENEAINLWKIQDKNIFQVDPKGQVTNEFSFDHIFQSKSNKEIYDEVVKSFVDSSLEGINSTIFAYGQTSSGKTYTMLGNEDNFGLIQYAITSIFHYINECSDRKFLIRISFIEIYNEKINDLLNENNRDIKIREQLNVGIVLQGVEEEIVTSPEQALKLLRSGICLRRTGDTFANVESSRSHTIFRIIIQSTEQGGSGRKALQLSHLNLIDLAGSERVAQTKATGLRLKEGSLINKSLSTLGLVIRQLSEGYDFVNFRDSKLTRLLQNSLGGNARTLVIANITLASFEDTSSTLCFAQRAKIVRNKPIINEFGKADDISEELISQYKKQLDEQLNKNKSLEEQKKDSIKKIDHLQKQLDLIQQFHGTTKKTLSVSKRRHTIGYARSALSLEVIAEDPEDDAVFGLRTPTKHLRDRIYHLETENKELRMFHKDELDTLKIYYEERIKQLELEIKEDGIDIEELTREKSILEDELNTLNNTEESVGPVSHPFYFIDIKDIFNQLKTLQNVLIKEQLNYEEEIKTLNEKINQLKNKNEYYFKENKTIINDYNDQSNKINNMEEQINNLNGIIKKLNEEKTEQFEELTQRTNDFKNEIFEKENKIKDLENQINQMVDSRRNEDKQFDELLEEKLHLQNELENRNDKINELENNRADLNEKLEKLMSQEEENSKKIKGLLEELQHTAQNRNDHVEELNKRIVELKHQKDEINQKLTNDYEKLKEERDAMEKQSVVWKTQVFIDKQSVEKLHAQLAEHQKTIQNLEKDVENYEKELKDKEEECKKRCAQIEESNSEIKHLKALLQSSQEKNTEIQDDLNKNKTLVKKFTQNLAKLSNSSFEESDSVINESFGYINYKLLDELLKLEKSLIFNENIGQLINLTNFQMEHKKNIRFLELELKKYGPKGNKDIGAMIKTLEQCHEIIINYIKNERDLLINKVIELENIKKITKIKTESVKECNNCNSLRNQLETVKRQYEDLENKSSEYKETAIESLKKVRQLEEQLIKSKEAAAIKAIKKPLQEIKQASCVHCDQLQKKLDQIEFDAIEFRSKYYDTKILCEQLDAGKSKYKKLYSDKHYEYEELKCHYNNILEECDSLKKTANSYEELYKKYHELSASKAKETNSVSVGVQVENEALAEIKAKYEKCKQLAKMRYTEIQNVKEMLYEKETEYNNLFEKYQFIKQLALLRKQEKEQLSEKLASFGATSEK